MGCCMAPTRPFDVRWTWISLKSSFSNYSWIVVNIDFLVYMCYCAGLVHWAFMWTMCCWSRCKISAHWEVTCITLRPCSYMWKRFRPFLLFFVVELWRYLVTWCVNIEFLTSVITCASFSLLWRVYVQAVTSMGTTAVWNIPPLLLMFMFVLKTDDFRGYITPQGGF